MDNMMKLISIIENKDYWIKKAEKLLEDKGIDVKVDHDKIGVNKKSVLVSIVGLNSKKDRKTISALRKIKNWKKEPHTYGTNRLVISHIEFAREDI